jgi:hypothetical protein
MWLQRLSVLTLVVLFFTLLWFAIKHGGPISHPKAVPDPTLTLPLPDHCRRIEAGALPDKKCTPGAINRHVTQSDIKSTICKPGWASSIRPPVSYTEPLKRKMVVRYGYGSTVSLRFFQFDHLIPLELGGNPTSVKNLWPQLYSVTVGGKQAGAFVKDLLEDKLNREVCDGKTTLSAARRIMRTGGWVNGRS